MGLSLLTKLHKAYNLVVTKVTRYFRANNKLICEMKIKIKLSIFFHIIMNIRVVVLSFKVV